MEEFSDREKELLSRYVTSMEGSVFALKNLPEVVKGALFSRYSRATSGLKSLLLKEFLTNADQETPFLDPHLCVQKAHDFYDRILDGYGDDSIGELGGTHLAMEKISMLAAKVVEDARIGGSPLEKSTRYVHFDQKEEGKYLYYREPTLMNSEFANLYESTCDHLFEVYSALYAPLQEMIQERFPKTDSMSSGAYKAALRAKVLDLLRGLLPASTLTNVGLFGNGRFFESLLQRLQTQSLAEMRSLGEASEIELSKVVPSFVRRGNKNHKHFLAHADYQGSVEALLEKQAARQESFFLENPVVRLVFSDDKSYEKLAMALAFPYGQGLFEGGQCPETLFEELGSLRQNRRHKSPRALELVSFTFQIIADFGAYRDLQRHRMLTQARQKLSCRFGYTVPQELKGTPYACIYQEAMEKAAFAYEKIAEKFPDEAQYVVPMGYNISWYFHINLRAAQWLCELRSQPAGHTSYRWIAQEMCRQICERFPLFKHFFKFVDWEGYALGRIEQEERLVAKGKR